MVFLLAQQLTGFFPVKLAIFVFFYARLKLAATLSNGVNYKPISLPKAITNIKKRYKV